VAVIDDASFGFKYQGVQAYGAPTLLLVFKALVLLRRQSKALEPLQVVQIR
jgi:hypothetical protein